VTETIEERFARVLAGRTSIDQMTHPGKNLSGDVRVIFDWDSLDIADFGFALEEEFEIMLDLEKAQGFVTIQDFLDAVKEQTG